MPVLSKYVQIVSDAAKILIWQIGNNPIPTYTAPVFANANGGLQPYPISISVGTVSVSISGPATYNFGLQAGWPHHHYHLHAWIEGATNFGALSVYGSFPTTTSAGAIVCGSQTLSVVAGALVATAVPQTVAVSYISIGD